MTDKYELIKFKDNEIELDVNVSPNEDTVWLTQDQISLLFERNRTVIGKHIGNIFKESELDENSVSAKFAHTGSDGKTYMVSFYNLDMIISVGYRVKSKRGILFRRWANNVLRQYLTKGYVINNDRCLICQQSIVELNQRVSELEHNASHQIEFNADETLKGFLFCTKMYKILEASKRSYLPFCQTQTRLIIYQAGLAKVQ